VSAEQVRRWLLLLSHLTICAAELGVATTVPIAKLTTAKAVAITGRRLLIFKFLHLSGVGKFIHN
jgi:hypothetical protein